MSDIRKEVEDILELVSYFMVHRKLPFSDLLEVQLHVGELLIEALQSHQLVCYPLSESAHSGVLHVPQQVLYADLLSLLSTNL